MKKLTLLLLLSMFVSHTAFSQELSEYDQALKSMTELSGGHEAFKSAIKQMMLGFKESRPEIEASIWDELEAEFTKTSLDELVSMLSPVYQKYMTIEDIRAITDFYRTTVGEKYARYSPQIVQESIAVGQEWGKLVGERFVEKLKERGY